MLVVDLHLLVRARVGNQEAIGRVNGHRRGDDAGGELDRLR